MCPNLACSYQIRGVFFLDSERDGVFSFFVVLQVVETNLVAFDCHWILINEVSAMEMIYGSCTWVVPSLHLVASVILEMFMVLGPELSYSTLLFKREESLKKFSTSFVLHQFIQ